MVTIERENLEQQQIAEAAAIESIVKKIKPLDVKDIPPAMSFIPIGNGVIVSKEVLVEKEDGRVQLENNFFLIPANTPLSIRPNLTDEVYKYVNGLAQRLDISEQTVLKAFITSRTLLDNYRSDNHPSVFLQPAEGPESLRLTTAELGDQKELEYYSSFYKQRGQPVLTPLTSIKLGKLAFPNLFKGALIFTIHVAGQHNILED